MKRHYKKEKLKAEKDRAEQDHARLQNDNNTTTNEYLSPEAMPPISEYKFYTKEAAINMAIIRGVATNTILVAGKLKIAVITSDELKLKIEEAVHKVDEVEAEFKKQTQEWWKQKWFTYTASSVLILFVVYKMFEYKAVPNFLGAIGEVAKDGATVDNLKDLHKPSLENTIKAIAETPIAPLTILTVVGALTISIGFLRAITFILRRVPK